MMRILLTKGYSAVVDDDDYRRVSALKWTAMERKRRDGSVVIVHAYRKDSDGSNIYLHRFILGISDSAIIVDHADGDGLNNAKTNLRTCTQAENSRNRRLSNANTSGAKGVTWHRGRRKWAAQITVDYRHVHLGLFQTVDEAAAAYDLAALSYFGRFANPNQAQG